MVCPHSLGNVLSKGPSACLYSTFNVAFALGLGACWYYSRNLDIPPFLWSASVLARSVMRLWLAQVTGSVMCPQQQDNNLENIVIRLREEFMWNSNRKKDICCSNTTKCFNIANAVTMQVHCLSFIGDFSVIDYLLKLFREANLLISHSIICQINVTLSYLYYRRM